MTEVHKDFIVSGHVLFLDFTGAFSLKRKATETFILDSRLTGWFRNGFFSDTGSEDYSCSNLFGK
jgi:hypothetical protein